MIIWCAHAGDAWLDRSVCAEPCNAMHLRCVACGAAIGGCPYEGPEQHDRFVRLVQDAVDGDEFEAQGIVGAVEQASRKGHPVTLDAARRSVAAS